ncbi:MAG TPA: YidC/Oxa1 family membrane protein insertase [Oscillospiraceae bacterium]|nr:YidC/Oxa1 family membrane protein insertase [Oscillospiraceae bacterium]
MIAAIVDVLNSILLAINDFTHNYGLSIIVLTILVRLVMWPLMSKQLSSAKAMQEIQPELKKIQEKYKNDKEKLNQATMELWQKHKINPAAGCLPLIVQMPILFAMFRMLQSAPTIDPQQYFLLGIDMRVALQSTVNGAAVWQQYPGYWILVILSGLTTYIQQKLTMTDPSQKMMMTIMPLMLLYFSLRFPAGLVLYWVVNNLLSLVQHLLIHRQPPKGAVNEQ